MKILIADDEYDILKTYEMALKGRGHKIFISENGEDCLKIYQDELKRTTKPQSTDNHYLSPFDVIILDYKMPKKDGLQVAKEILELNPNQRIVFASAYVMDTLEESVKELKRVVELIQKPFRVDTLVDTIEDKEAFEGLKTLIVNVRQITREKTSDLTQKQMKELFNSLRKIQKGRGF